MEANVKINGASYVSMLEDQFVPELVKHEKVLNEGLWLEDNAPAHKSGEVLAWKEANWPIREQHFPACSPDLSVLDYALWSLIKQKVRGV